MQQYAHIYKQVGNGMECIKQTSDVSYEGNDYNGKDSNQSLFPFHCNYGFS